MSYQIAKPITARLLRLLYTVKEFNCAHYLNNLSQTLFMHYSCKLDE